MATTIKMKQQNSSITAESFMRDLNKDLDIVVQKEFNIVKKPKLRLNRTLLPLAGL